MLDIFTRCIVFELRLMEKKKKEEERRRKKKKKKMNKIEIFKFVFFDFAKG